MPIYEFAPVDPSHPDWEVSDLKGRCRVHAPDEQRAMHYLRAWLNPDLYDCKGVISGPLPDYREGLIETDQGRGGGLTRLGPAGFPIANLGRERWVPFNVDNLPPLSEDTAPTGSAWAKGAWREGAWKEGTWGRSPPEVEIQKALEATRRQFVSQPQELVSRTRMARANTTIALEILDEFRGNSEQHTKIRALLIEQIEVFDTIENALSSDGSKEAAFESYVDQLHKILTNLSEVISEKGVIRAALATAACGLVNMTGIGGDVVIGPIVAASILGWDQKVLVKLVDGLGKFRKTQKKNNDD